MSILNRFNAGERLNLIQRNSFNIRSDLEGLKEFASEVRRTLLEL